MDGEIAPMPRRQEIEPTTEQDAASSSISATLAQVQYPLDTAPPVPMRSRQEILREAVWLVPNLAKLLFRLLADRRVPRRRRLAMALVGAYVASPIDLIPDFVPVLGTLDDLLVLAFAVDYLLRASPPELVEEYWDGSEDGLEIIRGLAGWGVELLPRRLRPIV